MNTVFVITVCRNAESLIEDTIKSVLSQTYPYIKYLIIDGASTDGTVDIIKKYADNLTYWVSEPDKGIYDAMNKGLAKARQLGDGWVNFMNAGDSFADDAVLEEIFATQDIHDGIKIIGGNTINYFPDGHTEMHYAESSTLIPTRITFSHQACIARLFPEWTFDTRYKFAADYNIFYQTYWKYGAESIITVNRAIARYRQEDSFSLQNAKKAKDEYLKIQSSHRNLLWWKEYLKWRLF